MLRHQQVTAAHGLKRDYQHCSIRMVLITPVANCLAPSAGLLWTIAWLGTTCRTLLSPQDTFASGVKHFAFCCMLKLCSEAA